MVDLITKPYVVYLYDDWSQKSERKLIWFALTYKYSFFGVTVSHINILIACVPQYYLQATLPNQFIVVIGVKLILCSLD